MTKSPKFDLTEALDIVIENFRDPKCVHLVRPYVVTLTRQQREQLANALEEKLGYDEAESIFIMLDDLFE
jgi:catabolite regulation protein CreA